MLNYVITQISFSLFFMLIFAGFVTAIGWCEPSQYRRRPVLNAVSAVFTVFGVFAIIKLADICSAAISPGDNFITSLSSLFNSLYDGLVLEDYIKYASDQVSALVFSAVAIVFIFIAFLLSFVFTFVLAFRIALRIDLKLKNTVRYIIIGFCVALTVIVGIIMSQPIIMLLFVIYELISAAFLVIGNYRLIKYKALKSSGTSDDKNKRDKDGRDRSEKKKSSKHKEDFDEDKPINFGEEEKEFFGNNKPFKFKSTGSFDLDTTPSDDSDE